MRVLGVVSGLVVLRGASPTVAQKTPAESLAGVSHALLARLNR